MTSYTEIFAQDRRLTILRILEKAPQFTSNEFLLQAMLAGHGHSVSRDLIRTDLAWLAEQSLVTTNTSAEIGIAHLTERGADVANGRATVPGVKRPAPGAG